MEINPGFSEKAQKDFELVLAAQDGNQAAFSELMSRYRDAIYFMILKMINNKIDAEDLTIEAFGKLSETSINILQVLHSAPGFLK
ncbi:MAG: hypothetical protein WCX31_21855 [Salinivirgaceae bacterium]